jgi:hypothetical protein
VNVVRAPAITEGNLGPAGWHQLHELAELRGRTPAKQVLALVHYALSKALAGEDVELSRSELESLFQGETLSAA